MSTYTYKVSADTLNNKVDTSKLREEITESTITIALSSLAVIGDDLSVEFKTALSTLEETELTSLVNNHTGEEIEDVAVEIDTDGRQVFRPAVTQKGWRYLAHVLEIETSSIGSGISDDFQGNSRGDLSLKFYNASGVELLNQTDIDANCVKTIATLAPDYDYDIISGNIHQQLPPTEDVRLYVTVGAPDLGPAGVKELVGGINLAYMGAEEQIETDGRSSARLNKETEGIPVATNKVQYIFKHNAGYKHKVMIVLEYFRV